MKKVFIRTLGCQMNVRDSEVVSGIIKQAGYSLVDDDKKADIVIFNTCSVRQHAEDKVWSAIGNIVKSCRARPKQKVIRAKPVIGLIGCMAQNYRDQVFQRSPEVDFVAGPSDIAKIPEILNKLTNKKSDLFQIKIWETDGQIRPEDIYHTGFYDDKEHAYVVISEGCSNFCSYCVVPYVRGELHNRKHKDILKEIETALIKGITRVTLLGQNVNAYKDGDYAFLDLLKAVNAVKAIKEFTFVTSHPRDTSIELFKAMAECDKLKKNLHLPVQSGSDRILKAMNRGYTRKFYLDLVDNYRKIIKGGGLTTDIIVGFSGESKEDFQDTFDLVKAVGFDAAYIFKYSPRPNTEALKWPDDVAKEEKERRHSRILELQKEISSKKKRKI
jgi:tRNA-2-methylthio-N6-dimethylallyladenosine synthase